jgi:hypothetical protein
MLAQDEEKDLKETRMPQLAQHGLFCDLSPPPSSTDPARSVYLVFPGFLPSFRTATTSSPLAASARKRRE